VITVKHKARLAGDRTKGRFLRQVAALPVRSSGAGAHEILLVTSRDTGRWIIPKGGLVRGLDAAASAAL
jgi:8-oxo-dGTP pyrophosphatase MutT (NUDIX family)